MIHYEYLYISFIVVNIIIKVNLFIRKLYNYLMYLILRKIYNYLMYVYVMIIGELWFGVFQ